MGVYRHRTMRAELVNACKRLARLLPKEAGFSWNLQAWAPKPGDKKGTRYRVELVDEELGATHLPFGADWWYGKHEAYVAVCFAIRVLEALGKKETDETRKDLPQSRPPA